MNVIRRIKKDRSRVSKQGRRAIKASVVVAILIASVPIVAAAQQKAQDFSSTSSVVGSIFQQSFGGLQLDLDNQGTESNVKGEQISTVESALEASTLAASMGIKTNTAPSDNFTAECIDVSNRSDVLVNEQGNLISYITEGEAQSEFSEISRAMEGGGWNCARSGVDTQGTFVKSSGSISWAYVNCINVGGETCVVIQIL